MKNLMYLLTKLINENCKHLSCYTNDNLTEMYIRNEDNIKVFHAYIVDEMMYITYSIIKDEEYAVEKVSCNVERFLITFEHILKNIAITDLEREDFNNIITELYLRIDDIYLPELKLGIEYNGTYWHSIEHGCDKYCHRNKSLACRKLGIRLIHIFEFEDLDEQIYKINQLILGNDIFEQTFTKNSLLNIPKSDPTIIYKDVRSTVYSA